MNKATSKLITTGDGKRMRISLGSLYVVNKPILALEHGRELAKNAFEILVAMSVGFSKDGQMMFYVIAIKKCSFFKRLDEILHHMSDPNRPFLIYSVGRLTNDLIKSILRVVRYYSRESEIIGVLKVIKNNISEIIKEIKEALKPYKEPQKLQLTKLVKDNIDKIIRAMAASHRATINIKRKHFFLFDSHLWCESLDIKDIKWHEVGRMLDIKQWPVDAIRLWAHHQLCLLPGSFEGLISDLYFFNNSIKVKENAIETIQRNNASKRRALQPKSSRSKDLFSKINDMSASYTSMVWDPSESGRLRKVKKLDFGGILEGGILESCDSERSEESRAENPCLEEDDLTEEQEDQLEREYVRKHIEEQQEMEEQRERIR